MVENCKIKVVQRQSRTLPDEEDAGHVVHNMRISYQQQAHRILSPIIEGNRQRKKLYAKMGHKSAEKKPLNPASTPMTSTSTQPASSRGDLTLNLEQKKSKGTARM
jgi:hypothetical protein